MFSWLLQAFNEWWCVRRKAFGQNRGMYKWVKPRIWVPSFNANWFDGMTAYICFFQCGVCVWYSAVLSRGFKNTLCCFHYLDIVVTQYKCFVRYAEIIKHTKFQTVSPIRIKICFTCNFYFYCLINIDTPVS